MPGAGAPGSLFEDVALPVRHEREVLELDPIPLLLPRLEPHPARGHHVKHMYPGIGGSVSPQGAVSSERQ